MKRWDRLLSAMSPVTEPIPAPLPSTREQHNYSVPSMRKQRITGHHCWGAKPICKPCLARSVASIVSTLHQFTSRVPRVVGQTMPAPCVNRWSGCSQDVTQRITQSKHRAPFVSRIPDSGFGQSSHTVRHGTPIRGAAARSNCSQVPRYHIPCLRT